MEDSGAALGIIVSDHSDISDDGSAAGIRIPSMIIST